MIEFIGTRKGYDADSYPVRDREGREIRATHRYSKRYWRDSQDCPRRSRDLPIHRRRDLCTRAESPRRAHIRIRLSQAIKNGHGASRS